MWDLYFDTTAIRWRNPVTGDLSLVPIRIRWSDLMGKPDAFFTNTVLVKDDNFFDNCLETLRLGLAHRYALQTWPSPDGINSEWMVAGLWNMTDIESPYVVSKLYLNASHHEFIRTDTEDLGNFVGVNENFAIEAKLFDIPVYGREDIRRISSLVADKETEFEQLRDGIRILKQPCPSCKNSGFAGTCMVAIATR